MLLVMRDINIGHVHKIIVFNRETRNMIATLPDLSPFGPPDSQPVALFRVAL